MKKALSLSVFFFSITFYGVHAQNFITKWTFNTAATSIRFNAQTAGGTVSYTWSASPSGNSGSGSFTMTSAGAVTLSGMTIAAGDIVTLSMQPNNLRRFYTKSSADAAKLTDVSQWGIVPWTSMAGAFYGCSNLNISATDIPILSAVTNMSEMFINCTTLNSPTNIANWNTSTVANMFAMFYKANAFNQPIGNWNTSSVTNMSFMLYEAGAFNQPVGSWSTSSVTDMSAMFYLASSFNQPIDSWNTSAVKSMSGMFGLAKVFNQPIGNWNTSAVTNMSYMFYEASAFNQPVGNWNTASVTNMNNMFSEAHAFNQPLNNWNTSAVTDMSGMFSIAKAFNQPINAWNTSNVSNMNAMFWGASSFNQSLDMWPLKSTVVLANMLNGCGMDYCNYSATLRGWAINNPTTTGRTLGAADMVYTSAVANAERALLINTRGWTISGDAPVGFYPLLVPEGNTIAAAPSCDDHVYIQPANTFDKILGLNANGNSFDYGAASVTVTNAFATTLPSGATTHASGFYEMNSGSNTLRVSRRLHSIQAPGSYATNGGVIIRVYYDPAEITALTDNSTLPAGSSPLAHQGWFKSSRHSAQDVVNDMTPAILNHALPVAPTGSGIENGVSYAEFTLSSFSTIGYYATSNLFVLPVKLAYFTGASNGCAVTLQWKSVTEENFSHYEIERSADGVSYSRIGTRQGVGNTQGSGYQYADEQVADGNRYYYRLRMVDKDGKIAYSKVISLKIDCAGKGAFAVRPNPAKDYATITVPVAGGVLSLYTADGRQLLSQKINSTLEVLPVMHIPKGMYLLRYLAPGGEMKVTKLLKE